MGPLGVIDGSTRWWPRPNGSAQSLGCSLPQCLYAVMCTRYTGLHMHHNVQYMQYNVWYIQYTVLQTRYFVFILEHNHFLGTHSVLRTRCPNYFAFFLGTLKCTQPQATAHWWLLGVWRVCLATLHSHMLLGVGVSCGCVTEHVCMHMSLGEQR